MTQTKTANPYDHFLIRTETPDEIQVKDFKTITVSDDGENRIKLFVANTSPFRFYVGYEIHVKDLDLNIYQAITETAKVGYSTYEQEAILYALGRITANYGEKLPEHIAHDVKQAMFDHRQMSIFDGNTAL